MALTHFVLDDDYHKLTLLLTFQSVKAIIASKKLMLGYKLPFFVLHSNHFYKKTFQSLSLNRLALTNNG